MARPRYTLGRGKAMTGNIRTREAKPLWLNVLIGLGLLLVLIAGILAVIAGDYIYEKHTKSLISVTNWSGSDVRFEKVILDNEILWEGPDVVVKSKNPERPWLDRHGTGPMPYFRAPRKLVELKLVVINQMQERETVSCTLDNRSGPCFFEVSYRKGRLSCGDCDKSFMH
jgi:hypothetical protein